MKNMDISLLLAIILGLTSFVSPILVTVINNFHQKRMKKLEIEQENIRNNQLYLRSIFDNYYLYAGGMIGHHDGESIAKYQSAYFQALTYADDDLRAKMKEVNSLIQSHEYIQAGKSLEALIDSTSRRQIR